MREMMRDYLKNNDISIKDGTDVNSIMRDMMSVILEGALDEELDEELGYSKYDYRNKETDNSRNGHSSKTMHTSYGDMDVAIPRDRNGDYEPQLIKKYQNTVTQDMEEKILSMYAKGMTTGDIESHMRELYDIDISDSTISRITDKILPIVKEWQERPLEEVYAVVFMDENFLLDTKTAQDLFHNHAAKMPIIDYHCHLIPEMVANDHKFKSITELWLGGDHYKWRAMRTNGVDERFCTGTDTSDWEKFEKWAETVPYTFRNPLYHWTHLELKTAFGIDKQLSPKTAREIYDECNEKLQLPEFSARGLMRHYNVECVCTTDDPIDDLRYHKQTRESGFEIKMIPAWRPDKAMNIEKPDFADYMNKLGEVAGVNLVTFQDMVDALQKRHDFFTENGCKLSDHGIEEFYDEPYTDSQIETIFAKAMRGQQLSALEIRQYKHAFLKVCAEMDHAADWTQQYHYGAIRDNNTLMYNKLGADTGFDSIGEFTTAKAMSNFLNELNMEGKLTRTILYTLNPCANEVIATMLGNFQDGSCPGKIQFGSGWWFNDQLDGMTRQMNALSVLGLLSRFVGMLTDSRSFLSYPRHEYFRRLLCNLLGNDVEKGLLPNDMESLSRMVEDISYNNARNYFKFY